VYLTPCWGGSLGNYVTAVRLEKKLEWCPHKMTLWPFVLIQYRQWQTDWRTDGRTDGIGETISRSACIACWRAIRTQKFSDDSTCCSDTTSLCRSLGTNTELRSAENWDEISWRRCIVIHQVSPQKSPHAVAHRYVGSLQRGCFSFYAMKCTVVTTTIRLRFDGRSTAYQRSLRSQWRNY